MATGTYEYYLTMPVTKNSFSTKDSLARGRAWKGEDRNGMEIGEGTEREMVVEGRMEDFFTYRVSTYRCKIVEGYDS